MIKTIIQTNKYFNEGFWLKAFINNMPNYQKKIFIQFVSNKNEFMENIINFDVCFTFKLYDELIAQCDKLKMIYLGISDPDYNFEGLNRNDIKLFTSKGLARRHIAEYCLAMSLILVKNLYIVETFKSRRKWEQTLFLDYPIKMLSDYFIGVLGLGVVGNEIVNIFNSNCRVIGCSKTSKPYIKLHRWFSETEIGEFLKYTDILIISLPLRSDTFHIINKKQFDIMGKNSFLINISRGNLINEEDLITALYGNTIRGAAIDVTSEEPLSKNSKLWKTPNLIITPHIAGNINLIANEIQEDFIEKLKINFVEFL